MPLSYHVPTCAVLQQSFLSFSQIDINGVGGQLVGWHPKILFGNLIIKKSLSLVKDSVNYCEDTKLRQFQPYIIWF